MDNARLTFTPIDLERHADLCARFRADSFHVSFGSDERVYHEHSTSPTTVHPDGRGRERSPDGKKIVFMSDRTGRFEIFVMNIDGSEQMQLTAGKTENAAPVWAP